MKYKSIINAILMPALGSTIVLSSLVASFNVFSAENINETGVDEKRWFEIEVILFEQNTKHRSNTEQFSSQNLNNKKRRALDLLGPYLQPDIIGLKQLLPSCEDKSPQLPYNISTVPYELWFDESTNKDNITGNLALAKPDNTESVNTGNESTDNEKLSPPNMSVKVISPEGEDKQLNDAKTPVQLQYANIELAVYNQYPSDKEMPFCIIPAASVVESLPAEQLKHFNLDGFPVEKTTTTIDGLEQWQDDDEGEITWASETPYLISQDSLKLKSIANRIKRSRDYSPLLHMGWRQVGESRRQSQAIRLFAGENLALTYQQDIAKQVTKQEALLLKKILLERQQAEMLSDNQLSGFTDENGQNETEQSTQLADNYDELNTEKTRASMLNEQQASHDAVEAEYSEKVIEISPEEQLRLRVRQNQLESIFEQFEQLADLEEPNSLDTETLTDDSLTTKNQANITHANEQKISNIVAELSSDISTNEALLIASENSLSDKSVTLIPPSQQWYLDGLFKVHLDHYLYINSEFNLLESSDKKINKEHDKASNNENVISFKQDRRVITGEIHYFDHPNMGMIVQIRRFDPTKPAAEAVSQAKK